MRKGTAILLFIMVIFLTMLILVGVFRPVKNWIYGNHINDKITHFLVACILTYLACFIFYPRKVRIFSHSILLGTALMFLLYSLDEVLQVLVPWRDADPFDLLASYAGLIVGNWLVQKWEKKQEIRQAPK